MKKAAKALLGLASLTLLVFLALLVGGVFTALDSAGKLYTPSNSELATEPPANEN